jgi:predicted transcriptional regulator with HTH domain
MPRISKSKQDKIAEQILFYLYQIFPKQVFTSDIAKELARDEEFTKSIMLNLQKKELVIKVDKNPNGVLYQKRSRWRLSNKVHSIYLQQSSKKPQIQLEENN